MIYYPFAMAEEHVVPASEEKRSGGNIWKGLFFSLLVLILITAVGGGAYYWGIKKGESQPEETPFNEGEETLGITEEEALPTQTTTNSPPPSLSPTPTTTTIPTKSPTPKPLLDVKIKSPE